MDISQRTALLENRLAKAEAKLRLLQALALVLLVCVAALADLPSTITKNLPVQPADVGFSKLLGSTANPTARQTVSHQNRNCAQSTCPHCESNRLSNTGG
jgi:hypothetical protein